MHKRSQFNRRVRHLWAAFVCLQQELAQLLSSSAAYEVVDCAPAPHCSLGQAISHDRHWLFGKKGRGGNHGGWYYGEQLLLCASENGVVTGWMLGLANIDDRWLMEAFVSSRRGCKCLTEPELPKRRQIVETVSARLTDYFELQRVNAHSELGMLTRIAAKMAAYNIAILFNRMVDDEMAR